MSKKLVDFRRVVRIAKLAALVFMAFFYTGYASNGGIPILIKGKVTDVFSGMPTKLEMVFVDEEGSKIKCLPNILEGHYEQVLTSGKTYTVYFVNYDVARELYSINIPDFERYEEVNKDWKVKKLAQGNSIYNDNVFLRGSAELSPQGIVIIKQFSNILKFNRGAKFDLMVSLLPGEEHNAKLLQDRVDAISKLPELKRYMSKINVISAEKGDYNFNLKVTEIVDPLN